MPSARSFGELKHWPREALDFIYAAFERVRLGAGPTWPELLADLQAKFGLPWNDSSLSRYYGYWRSVLYVEDQAREDARATIQQVLANPNNPDIITAAEQKLEELNLIATTQLRHSDPVKVVGLNQRARRLRLDERRVAQDDRRIALLERKLAAIEAKHAAANSKVDELVEAKAISPEAAQKIRAIYGVSEEPEVSGQ